MKLPNGINIVAQSPDLKRKSQSFSKRELEVCSLILQGKTNKEIGERLFIAEKTVKYHTWRMYNLAGVSSRAEFIIKQLKVG